MLFGYKSDEIYKIFKKYVKKINYIDFHNFFNIGKNFLKTGKIVINGLNSGESIYKLMNELCSKKGINKISEIKTPLLIPAVNIYTEDLYVFSSKKIENLKLPPNIKYVNDINIGVAVQASCSYPGIFTPCDKYKNTLLIDGGIQENIPWRETKRIGADEVLSIVFSNETPKKCCNNVFEIIGKSFDILSHELSRYELDGTDYLLKIKHDSKGLLNKNDLDILYKKGYIQTKEFIKRLS